MSIIFNSVTTSPTDASKVPSEYTVINSITSSWTQWIDTWYKPSVNTEIYASFWWGTQTTAWAVFWWVTSNDKSSDWIVWRMYYDLSSTWNTNTFNPWFCNTTYSEWTIDMWWVWKCIVSQKKWWTSITWKVNPTQYGKVCALVPTTTTWTPYSWNIYLFCWNNWWSAWRQSKCTIYRFKISEWWKMIRDFIPVQKTSDSSVKWLYDLVEWKFYWNNWTWTFS